MYIDSHLERCVLVQTEAVQSWEVCALEIEFFQWWPYNSYRELFFKVPCTAVHELYRSNLVCIDSHLDRCDGPNSIAVQAWEVCELEFDFFDCGSLCIYLWRFFKVTCAAVQELYRSNLVCTLIPILKGVFWSKQHSCSVLGSMCTGN